MTWMNRLSIKHIFSLGTVLLVCGLLLAGCGGTDEGDLNPPSIQMASDRIYSPVFEPEISDITVLVEPGASVTVETESTALVDSLAQTASSVPVGDEIWDQWNFNLTNLASGSNNIFITAEDKTGNTNTLLFVPQYVRLTIENFNKTPQTDTQIVRGLIAPGMYISRITVDGVEDGSPFPTASTGVSTWEYDLSMPDSSVALIVYVKADGGTTEYKTSSLTFTRYETKPDLTIDNSPLVQTADNVTLYGTLVASADVDIENFDISFPTLGTDEANWPTVGIVSYDSVTSVWSVNVSNLKLGLTRILVKYVQSTDVTASAQTAILREN